MPNHKKCKAHIGNCAHDKYVTFAWHKSLQVHCDLARGQYQTTMEPIFDGAMRECYVYMLFWKKSY